jgi:2-polyprenyl-3-methyl-5-hydroxy-6-metoxy-1,4-benzoquinol methylase
MPSGYDRIARFYDTLARSVFGKSITLAQQCGLSEIIPGSNILIVGGGTGYVLEYLSQCGIEDLHVDYVEASQAMIMRTRHRKIDGLPVNFVHRSIGEIDEQKTFDVIITQFFLDSFQGKDLERLFTRLHEHLRIDGTWIIADFQVSKDWKAIWQKPLLSIMYLFFTITVGIKARRLDDFHTLFIRSRYCLITSQSYYCAFMFSSTYQKSEKKVTPMETLTLEPCL